jgi:hypothetical protein
MMRTCPDCGAGLTKGQHRCESCRLSRRKHRERSWPSRRTSCVACGKVRKGKRLLCKRCSDEQSRKLVPCPRCSTPFWPWACGASHARKYCGCKPLPKQKPKPHFWAGFCAWCGEPFEARKKTSAACSPACQKRIVCQRKHLRRRGIRRSGSIPLTEIYTRDAGRCGLCRRHVRFDLQAPHPKSATLDHIIPVGKGGLHVRSNVQLAHYGCNSAKRDRSCGSQLRLAV